VKYGRAFLFASLFRWVFRFSPGEDGAEHEPVDEGTLGGFSRVLLPLGLLHLRWVFENDFGDDGGLLGREQERCCKRPLDDKIRGYGCFGFLLGLGGVVSLDI